MSVLLERSYYFHSYSQIIVIIRYISYTVIFFVKFNCFIKFNNFAKPLWNGSYSLKNSSYILFPFTLIPTQWERVRIPTASIPFYRWRNSGTEKRRNLCGITLRGQPSRHTSCSLRSALLVPWNSIFLSVWGVLLVTNFHLLWPISKRSLSLAKRNLLFFFASKFFLLSCLEKVVLWPIQCAIQWFRNKYVVQLSLSRC